MNLTPLYKAIIQYLDHRPNQNMFPGQLKRAARQGKHLVLGDGVTVMVPEEPTLVDMQGYLIGLRLNWEPEPIEVFLYTHPQIPPQYNAVGVALRELVDISQVERCYLKVFGL